MKFGLITEIIKMIFTWFDITLFAVYFILLFLSIFWLLVFFSDGIKNKSKLSRYPLFSVIVPAYNEEESIENTLKSLIDLEYPMDKIEIVVVNDGSTDKTSEIVKHFILNHPENNITLLQQDNHGKGRAMNHGLKIIQGEFFACLDADSFAGSNALEEMLPYFEDDLQVAAVCPILKVQRPRSILQKVQWCEYIINMFYKFLNSKIDCIHVTPGPFSIYRTSVIKELGGFDETTITEDLEIAIRLQKHQYKIVQTFDTITETVAPSNWRSLFHQRVRWYRGSVDNSLKYKQLMFNRKYGDFGFLRMPTIILSGLIAIILTGTLAWQAFSRFFHWITAVSAVNFDFITLLKHFELNLNWLNLPFFKLAIALTLLAISFFIMVYSYKLVKEDIRNHGKTWVSLVTYLLIYSLFLSCVWIYIAYSFITGKKNKWT
ncbi:MAG TPA: glycosyltransferase [Candidatus Nanoarchaeia archaeon]|nr:glycosyltransferase [Candidatus Nanoarchaeia archaeon]